MANKEHISKQFDADLEEVRTRVLQMGGFVEEQIEYAIEALTSGNEDLITQVITRDPFAKRLRPECRARRRRARCAG